MAPFEIPITRGRVALIDANDFSLVGHFAWHVAKRGCNVYAASMGARDIGYYMHRVIAGAKAGQHVDHRNGDGLDNRRANLRICSNAQNRCNMRIERGVSRYKGVSFDARQPGRPWTAYINFAGRRRTLGAYPTEVEAARAYNAASLKLHGDFACINSIEGLSYEESILAPMRNHKPGRPPSRNHVGATSCRQVGG